MDQNIFKEFDEIPKQMEWLIENFEKLSPVEMLVIVRDYMNLGTTLNEIYRKYNRESDNHKNYDGEKTWEDIKYIFKWKGENEDDQHS